MRKFLLAILTSLLTLSAFAQFDSFAGFYKGEQSGTKKYPLNMSPDIYAEVYKGGDSYRLKILADILCRGDEYCVVEGLKAENGEIKLVDAGALKLNGKITPEGIEATGVYAKDPIKLSLKRYKYESPTLGAKAPAGATVLFDGKDTSKWELCANKQPINWIINGDGSMTVKNDAKKPDGKPLNSSIQTKDVFGAFKLHLEFMTPGEYDKFGQDRSNSGVIMGPYEVQILDSFGDTGANNQCGSLYRQTPPQSNACLEPGAWQTYDIIYTPAKFNGKTLVAYPTFTVYLNGVRIHNETPVTYGTSMSEYMAKKNNFQHPTKGISIQLQDHTNPIKFRNIWLQAL